MTGDRAPISWVIGRGGLLGRSVERRLATSTETWRPSPPLTWADPDSHIQIADAARAFGRQAAGRPWFVAWCAGSGVTSSTSESLARESVVLETLLATLADERRAGRLGTGGLFHSSSAGGLYAGSASPPFDEHTDPEPISPYGFAKLEQEALVAAWSRETRVPTLIGRIANLYGPGQNLAKPQGLISHLCWQQLLQLPISIYVPLDTIRDYLYAPDCARMITAGLTEISAPTAPGRFSTVKVLASQRPTTVGALLGEFKRVTRRNARSTLRATEFSRFQARDLRLRSLVLPQIDRLASTSLPEGLYATHEDLRRRLAKSGRH